MNARPRRYTTGEGAQCLTREVIVRRVHTGEHE